MIRCPVHDMPDCSPLLNGCDRVIEIHKFIAREVERRMEQNDTFVCECVLIEQDGRDWYSTFQNTSDEGVQTQVRFFYPDCDGVSEGVGDKITLTLHIDEYGGSLSTDRGSIQA